MENENYYDKTLMTIREKIENKELDQAEKLLAKELEMPYIPAKYEKEFDSLFLIIKRKKSDLHPTNALSIDTIIEMLYSKDKNEQIVALNTISKHNLRPHLQEIKRRIETFENVAHKAILFEILAEQEISIDINISNNIMNPTKDSLFQNKQTILAFQYIANDCGESPQIVEAAIGVLNEYILSRFPKKIEDGLLLAKNIIVVVKSIIIGGVELNAMQKDIAKALEAK